MEEIIKRNYYSVIPNPVRFDKNVCADAKLLYADITALCNEKGHCWASNAYFAELFGVSERTVMRWIDELIGGGHILRRYEKAGTRVTYRYLILAESVRVPLLEEPEKEPDAPSSEPVTNLSANDKSVTGTGDKFVTGNNKFININIKHDDPARASVQELFSSSFLIDCHLKFSFEEYRKAAEKWNASEWAQDRFKCLSKVHEYFAKLCAGIYDKRKVFPDASKTESSNVVCVEGNKNFVSRNLTAAELSAQFTRLSPDEL